MQGRASVCSATEADEFFNPAARNARAIASVAFGCRKASAMSKEKPDDDPRRETDWGSSKQTDKPWTHPVEKDQKPGSAKPDLERWGESDTH
jgi:hypothetical protein